MTACTATDTPIAYPPQVKQISPSCFQQETARQSTCSSPTSGGLSPYVIHHRSDIYHHPERFDPDRWIDSPPRPNTYIPFGGGARKCIGDQFGIIEATLALATMASRWTMTPAHRRPVRPAPAITLKPRDLRMRATSRSRYVP